MAHFEGICREKGLSLTIQRRVILQELLDRHDHPTADQIYESVRGRLPGLSRTTVYRVLDTLVEVGAVRKLFHPDAVVRFDTNGARHHHLVCQECGRLVDLEADAIDEIRLPTKTTSGFRITDYSINFIGVCSECEHPRTERSGKWPKN